jgi:DNA polymerase-3 subunit epsilon
LLRDLRFTAIDFESAGAARGRTDTPVQVGLACWSAAAGHHDPFVSYLKSDQPVAWSARKVHGITDAHLVGAPALLALWPELKSRLTGAVVVAHGKGTEKRFLRAFPGHGFGPWIDTLLLARAAWPELPDHSLGALADRPEMARRALRRGRLARPARRSDRNLRPRRPSARQPAPPGHLDLAPAQAVRR